MSCLLAPVTHSKGTDTRPSMSVRADGRSSVVRCFGCGHSSKSLASSLMTLARMSNERGLGRELAERAYAAAEVARLADIGADTSSSDVYRSESGKRKVEVSTGLDGPLAEMQKNPWRKEHIEFLASRGVALETAQAFRCAPIDPGKTYEALYDSRKDKLVYCRNYGILLPTMSRAGVCIGASVRNFVPGPDQSSVRVKVFTPWHYSSSYFLYGQQFSARFEGIPLMLVEGAFDVMHLMAEGIPALALNGTTFSTARADYIASMRPSRVGAACDPDSAGQRCNDQIVDRLTRVGVPVDRIPLTQDPKYLSRAEVIAAWPAFAAVQN